MNFIRRVLRAALLSDSELATLQERQKQPLNITKDTTMELITYGPSLQELSSKVSLANLPEVKRLVAETAITNLFTKKHFDICQVRAVMEIVGGSQNSDAFKQLHALHCVDYADMPEELRQILPRLLNETFTSGRRKTREVSSALNGVI